MKKKIIKAFICFMFLGAVLCGCEIDNMSDSGYRVRTSNHPIVQCEMLYDVDRYDAVISKATKLIEDGQYIDEAYNLVSISYLGKGENLKALEAIDKALEYGEANSTYYANKALALLYLERYDEALEWAETAIKKSSLNYFPYYVASRVNYQLGNYEECKKQAEIAYENGEKDVANLNALFFGYLGVGDYDMAETLLDIMKEDYPDEYSFILDTKELYIAKGSYGELMDFYKDFYDTYKEYPDAIFSLGIEYHNIGKYRMAQKCFDETVEFLKHSDRSIYLWMANNSVYMGEREDAEEYLRKYKLKYGEDSQWLMSSGLYFEGEAKFKEAANYYERAYSMNEFDIGAVEGLIRNRNKSMRFKACIEEYERMNDIHKKNKNNILEVSNAYVQKDMVDKGIEMLIPLIDDEEYGINALRQIIVAYIMEGNYKDAKIYADKLLKVDYEDLSINEVMKIIERREDSVMIQVTDFFKENYLYDDKVDIDRISEKYKNKSADADILKAYIDEVKLSGDRFTYVVSGEDYDRFNSIDFSPVVFKTLNESVEYVGIAMFDKRTDDLFIEGLDKIDNTEDKTLIIDLRNNGGGSIKSAGNIISQFLEGDVACNLIYRDGSTESYNTDFDKVSFKEIKIFVNENTASSAELLTLSLRTYLDNVQVIGRDTFGKGVGQSVYDNKELKISIAVVSMYWNVKEKNIMETKIKPDIYVQGDDIKNYIEATGIK